MDTDEHGFDGRACSPRRAVVVKLKTFAGNGGRLQRPHRIVISGLLNNAQSPAAWQRNAGRKVPNHRVKSSATTRHKTKCRRATGHQASSTPPVPNPPANHRAGETAH